MVLNGPDDPAAMNLLDSSATSMGSMGAYPDETPCFGVRQVGNFSMSSDEAALQAGPGVSCASPRPRSRASSFDDRRDGSPMPSARRRDASVPRRPLSARRMYGPERFHYDTTTYTGVWKHGGPSIMDKCGINMYSGLDEMVRPHLRRGGTFMSSHGNPLSKKCPSALLLPLREEDRARWEMGRLRKSSSSSQLSTSSAHVYGPDRFYYDKSSYTGIHRYSPGGPLEVQMGAPAGSAMGSIHPYPDQCENVPPDMMHMGNYAAPAQQLSDDLPPWPHEPLGSVSIPSARLPRPQPFEPGSSSALGAPDGRLLYDYGDPVTFRRIQTGVLA